MAETTSITVKNATPEQRKKWTEKAKKTRAKKRNEKQTLLNELASQELKELLGYSEKLDFCIRALKAGKLSQKEKDNLLEVLFLVENL